MAKELSFQLSGELFSGDLVKLEREKLYGRSEIIASDNDGNPCTPAHLVPEGTLIVPAGAVKPAMLDRDGLWLDKADLVPFDEQGNPVEPAPSSFDSPITLVKKASREEFLDHFWKAVYQFDNQTLADKIGDDIYAFPFSYRGGPVMDEGFLLAANGSVYLFSGEPAEFPCLGIEEQGVLEAEENEDVPDADEIDFDMM